MAVRDMPLIIEYNARSIIDQGPGGGRPPRSSGQVSFRSSGPNPALKWWQRPGNGEEALEKYRELRPGVVLMDLSMPVMDGISATRAILDEFPDAKVIVLTTYDGDEDIHRALDAGAMGYLVKDMMAPDVLNVIRTVHGGRRGIPHAVPPSLPSIRPAFP